MALVRIAVAVFFAALSLMPAAALAQAAATPPAATGPSSIQETYDSWQVICRPGTDQRQRCSLVQTQLDQKTRQRVLALEINAAAPDKAEGIAVLPFGLGLEQGVTLVLGDQGSPALHFKTCLPAGCVVRLSFDGKDLALLRKTPMLTMKAFSDDGREVAFKVDLKGFAPAFDRALALGK